MAPADAEAERMQSDLPILDVQPYVKVVQRDGAPFNGLAVIVQLNAGPAQLRYIDRRVWDQSRLGFRPSHLGTMGGGLARGRGSAGFGAEKALEICEVNTP